MKKGYRFFGLASFSALVSGFDKPSGKQGGQQNPIVLAKNLLLVFVFILSIFPICLFTHVYST